MNRRRLLLSYIANSFSWELYSKTYFYNELVPTTINSKNVLNKAKIVKVSGNGAIENQLVQISNLRNIDVYGVSIVNNGDGSITINGTYTGSSTNFLSLLNNNISIQANHRYFLFGGKSTANIRFYDGYGAYVDNGSGVLSGGNATTSSQTITLVINVGASFNNVRIYPQITDLTLREGTGNEPTTLTDNRIQNILNRGYIPYNLGEYKGTDIGEFNSEPYNLWNNVLENGYIDGTGAFISSTSDCRTDYIAVIPSRSYVFGNENFTIANGRRVFEYDENKNFIKNTNHWNTTTDTITLQSNTHYVAISYNGTAKPDNPEICVHLSGTRTGYAPYKSFTPITFKAQLNGAINSHDTFEITKTDYVFTKNVGSGSFIGTETWVDWAGSGTSLTTTITPEPKGVSSNSTIANLLSIKGVNSVTNISSSPEYTIGINTAGRIYLATTKNASSLNTYLQSNPLDFYYEFATPQVITIPRKHLGIVDLGTLSYSSLGSGTFSITDDVGKTTSNNLYVSSLITTDFNSLYNKSVDFCIARATNGKIWLYNSAFASLSNQQIKEKLSGTYLFYETENEVADITDVIDIESGGTITTDSEVLPNVELNVKCK